jgi:hypothetical protein
MQVKSAFASLYNNRILVTDHKRSWKSRRRNSKSRRERENGYNSNGQQRA